MHGEFHVLAPEAFDVKSAFSAHYVAYFHLPRTSNIKNVRFLQMDGLAQCGSHQCASGNETWPCFAGTMTHASYDMSVFTRTSKKHPTLQIMPLISGMHISTPYSFATTHPYRSLPAPSCMTKQGGIKKRHFLSL
jgi:hypothetical protein